MSVTLGIDQSYTNCAYVVFNDDVVIDFGVITSDTEKTKFQRALDIANELCNVYERFTPDVVKIEGLAFGISGNATRDLAGLLFTIVNIMNNKFADYKYILHAPTSVKKFACGVGSAKKNDMINAVPEPIRNMFKEKGFKKTTGLSDLCDAYWIGLCK